MEPNRASVSEVTPHEAWRQRRRELGFCESCHRLRETARHCGVHRRWHNRKQTSRDKAKRAKLGKSRPAGRAEVRCGDCGVAGHNRQTCRGEDIEKQARLDDLEDARE